MKTIQTTIALGAVLLVGAMGAHRANAMYSHIDAQGLAMQHQAEDLLNVIRTDFPNTAQYSLLLSDGHRIYQRAAHLREVAQRRGSLTYLRADLTAMRTIGGDIARLLTEAEQASGSALTPAAARVRSILARMETSLRRMEAAVDATVAPVVHTTVRSVYVSPEPYVRYSRVYVHPPVIHPPVVRVHPRLTPMPLVHGRVAVRVW